MERTPSMSELNEIMYGQVKNSYYVINFVYIYTFEFVSLFFANQFGSTVVLHACTNLTAVSLNHLDSNWLYELNLFVKSNFYVTLILTTTPGLSKLSLFLDSMIVFTAPALRPSSK